VDPELVFLICNYGVIPAWLLLVVAPNWSWTDRLVQRVWIPMLLALVYGWVFVFSNPGASEGGSFTSLDGVMTLFADPYVALGGWVHYLVFDLFVGAWEVRDAQRHRIPHGFVIPCLLLTLMLGPLGLLAYLVLRWGMRGDVSLNEGAKRRSND